MDRSSDPFSLAEALTPFPSLRQLGMALPHQDQVIDALLGGDAEKRQLLCIIIAADATMMTKLHKLLTAEAAPPAPKGTFRDGVQSMRRRQREGQAPRDDDASGIRDRGRYAEKLKEEVEEAIQAAETDPKKIRMQIVRATPSNRPAREFLYEQYQGRCQVNGTTFQKADGTNFFEAVCLVSRLGADHLNHPGNMLALSADLAAKVTLGAFEWIDDLEEKVASFRTAAEGGAISDRQVRVQIVGEEHNITWTEQHFVRLIALWDLA